MKKRAVSRVETEKLRSQDGVPKRETNDHESEGKNETLYCLEVKMGRSEP